VQKAYRTAELRRPHQTDERATLVRASFQENAVNVQLYCPGAQSQFVGDFFITQAASDQECDFAFARA